MVSLSSWGAMPSYSSAWPHTPPSLPFLHSSKTLVRPSTGPAPSFALPTRSPSTSTDIERLYGERKLLAERKPLPLPAAQCLQRAAVLSHNRSFSVTSTSSAGVSEDTAIDTEGPEFDLQSNSTDTDGAMDNGVGGMNTPMGTAKVTKHDLLNQYFRKDVVVWSNLDWFRYVHLTLSSSSKLTCLGLHGTGRLTFNSPS